MSNLSLDVGDLQGNQARMISVASGRGLWIGLLADTCVAHDSTIEVVEKNNVCEFVRMVKEPHITLAHLGRKNGTYQVNAALSAAQIVASLFDSFDVSVEGLLRMNRHVAVAVATTTIDAVGHKLDAALLDRGVRRDETFAGLRHVTLGEIIDSRECVRLPKPMKYSLHFARMIVVCGDIMQEFRLGSS